MSSNGYVTNDVITLNLVYFHVVWHPPRLQIDEIICIRDFSGAKDSGKVLITIKLQLYITFIITVCKSARETLYHLLLNCPQPFWIALNFYAFFIYKGENPCLHLKLFKMCVLFGVLTGSYPLLNHLKLIFSSL